MREFIDAGQVLKAARIAAGFSQSELASKLGTKFQHLSAWERGRQKIPEKSIPMLLDALPKLDARQLRTAMAWDADPFMIDDLSATEQFGRLIGDAKGTVYAFSGKEAGFSNPSMVEGARRFLQDPANKVVFILAPLDDEIDKWVWQSKKVDSDAASSLRALGPYSDGNNIRQLRNILSGGVLEVSQRITFYSLNLHFASHHSAELIARLLPLSRLLYPLTVTILFDPEDSLFSPVGIIYIRRGLATASKGDYTWLRPTSDFLGRLSQLMKVTLTAKNRSQFLKEIGDSSQKT